MQNNYGIDNWTRGKVYGDNLGGRSEIHRIFMTSTWKDSFLAELRESLDNLIKVSKKMLHVNVR